MSDDWGMSDLLGGGYVKHVRFEGLDDVWADIVTQAGVEFRLHVGESDISLSSAACSYMEISYKSPDYHRFMFWLHRWDELSEACAKCDALMSECDTVLPVPGGGVEQVAVWSAAWDKWWEAAAWPTYDLFEELPLGDPGPPDMLGTMFDPTDGSVVTGTIEQLGPILRAIVHPEAWDKGLEDL